MPSAERISTPTSKSGITETSTGERLIPSSTRADGSVRKEIRVRAGYRPPEDVEIYKNRTAEAFKNRGKGGVPGADFIDESRTRKPVKKANQPEAGSKADTSNTAQAGPTRGPTQDDKAAKEPEPEPEPIDPEAEKQKEARKLSKKLRQAKELQQKKDKGDALLPEQFEKVIRINELMRQLDALGFDQEGKKKG